MDYISSFGSSITGNYIFSVGMYVANLLPLKGH